MEGKVYKVQFDDGHYYIGSTTAELQHRLTLHKSANGKYKTACSQHMEKVGKDTCCIVLLELCDEEEAKRLEDKYICEHMNNPLCLNKLRAVSTPEQTRERIRRWRVANAEKIKADARAYYLRNKIKRQKGNITE